MPVDLNKAMKKLKKQNPMGVSREGTLREKDPRNDGSRNDTQGETTLLPQKHFVV